MRAREHESMRAREHVSMGAREQGSKGARWSMRASDSEAGSGQPDVYSFKNLEFYQKARVLAVDAVRLARRLPKDDASRVIARQFVASVTSIRANIAEGHGRYCKAAYRNHLSIARGSAAETEDWVDLLVSLDLMSAAEGRQLTARCEEIIASL